MILSYSTPGQTRNTLNHIPSIRELYVPGIASLKMSSMLTISTHSKIDWISTGRIFLYVIHIWSFHISEQLVYLLTTLFDEKKTYFNIVTTTLGIKISSTHQTSQAQNIITVIWKKCTAFAASNIILNILR